MMIALLIIGLLALLACWLVIKVVCKIFKFLLGFKIIMWTMKFVVVCFALITPVALWMLIKGGLI